MKKVCIVTTVSLTIRAFILPIVRYLHENTHWELAVICDDDPTLVAELPDGVRYIPVPMKRGISFSGIGAIFKMAKIFREEKFDIVQYSTPNASLYASIAAWLAGIQYRKYHLMGFRFLGFTGAKKWLFKSIEKLCCALSTDVECVSASNLKLGIEQKVFPERKANVLFYGSTSGVDLTRFSAAKKELWRKELREQFGYQEQMCVFCFAGRMTGDKGINELITAFRQMDSTDSRLFLVGQLEEDSGLDAALLQWASECENVRFHPFVSDIERYFAMADVLVLPSYREGFGNIVIEAQAMGIPVIVSDIPGPTDAMVANETGLLIPVKDAEALTLAMKYMAENRSQREKMGRQGQLFVEERFDQKKICQQILLDRKRMLSEQ